MPTPEDTHLILIEKIDKLIQARRIVAAGKMPPIDDAIIDVAKCITANSLAMLAEREKGGEGDDVN